MQKRLGQIDMNTGEIFEDGFVAYVVPKRKNGFARWMSMSQEAMLWLSRDAIGDLARQKLGLQEFAVFWCLLAHVEYENHVLTPQAEMAAKIGMDRTNFNHAVRKLTQRGIFEKGPKIGRVVSLKMNPEYGWKGSAQNHVIELQSEFRRRMKAAGISRVIDGGTNANAKSDPTLEMSED